MIIVIGAGPAGLAAAKEAKAELVLEEHGEIGRPVSCAGLISKSGIDALGVYGKGYVLNRVKGARFCSPNESFLVKAKETKAYVVDRGLFDQSLAEGIEVKTGCKVERVGINGLVEYSEKGKKKKINADAVILACGPNNALLKQVGAEYPGKNMLSCAQYEIECGMEEDLVELHFGRETAPNFFAWKIPAGDVARVGVGVRGERPALEHLKRFVEKEGIKGKIKAKLGGIVPIKGPLKRIVYGKALVCGDAAGQVKPTTGGGVVTGITAGRIAGKIAKEHVEKGTALEEYGKQAEEKLGKDFRLGLMMRELSDSLTDSKMDALFKKIREEGLAREMEKHGDMDRPSTLLKMDQKKIAGLIEILK